MNDYALIEKILMVAGSILATYYALRERILKLESEVKGLHSKMVTEADKVVELRKEMKERFDVQEEEFSDLAKELKKEMKERFDAQDRDLSNLNKKIFERLDALVVSIHKIELRLTRNEIRTNLNQDPQHEND